MSDVQSTNTVFLTKKKKKYGAKVPLNQIANVSLNFKYINIINYSSIKKKNLFKISLSNLNSFSALILLKYGNYFIFLADFHVCNVYRLLNLNLIKQSHNSKTLLSIALKRHL